MNNLENLLLIKYNFSFLHFYSETFILEELKSRGMMVTQKLKTFQPTS
jgi:hypothetical protein